MNTKKYLVINSSDREIGGTPSNFKLKLPHSLQFQHCELIYCMISNTFFNITDANNSFYVNNVKQTLVNGCYNFDELMQTILPFFPALTNIYYDDVKQQLTITNDSFFRLSFPSTGSIASVLGFTNEYNVNTSDHNSFFPPSLCDTEIFIEINELSSNFMSSSSRYMSPTFTVPNQVNKNEFVIYNKYSNYVQEATVKNSTLQYLNIKLKNQYGEILQRCSDWSLILQFS